jgi:hypothetical protein
VTPVNWKAGRSHKELGAIQFARKFLRLIFRMFYKRKLAGKQEGFMIYI